MRTFLGLLLGGMVGTAIGWLFGMGHNALADTSCFEGLCGFIVVGWMLAGLVLGMVTGAILSRRGPKP